MEVQVKKEGMVYLPSKAMAAFGIKERDILHCSLTQTGILLALMMLRDNKSDHKKISTRIECFGKFSIYQEGRYCPMKNRKAEEMLSYLCCNGKRAVKKRMLEELMWAEAERGKARDSLYKVCAFVNQWQKTEGVMT